MAAFKEALKFRPRGGQYWLAKLDQIQHTQLEVIFRQIPPHLISEPGIEFALKMLEINTQRLLKMEI